jgi:hypothetical protein
LAHRRGGVIVVAEHILQEVVALHGLAAADIDRFHFYFLLSWHCR